MSDTLAAARALYEAGISVVAVQADGSKRPRGNWKEFQTRRANQQELIQWFGTQPRWPAIGVITGDISGNLEMAEIEGRAAGQLQALEELAYGSGLGPLWEKVAGWIEESPSGGVHWFYRLTETPAGNTKLASRPATPEELAVNPHEKRKVLAETRGQGGFVVTAPSNGTTHETGRPWRIITGGPATVPTLTPEEHAQFHDLLRTLNVEPAETPAPARTAPAAPASGLFGGVSPGDDFEAKTDWKDILEPAGWQYLRTIGRTRYWRRPGKTSGEGSATTGNSEDRDRLFVFSSSTEFEQEVPYTKFGAYALLNHGDNHSEAASALKKLGFGKDPEISTGARPSNTSSPFSTAHLAAPAGAPGSAEAPQRTIGPARTADPATDPKWQSTGNLATVTNIATRQHPDAPASTVANSDDGNMQRLILAHGHELRYNSDAGRWLWWNGQRWEEQPGNGGKAKELAKETIRAIDSEGNKTLYDHKKKSLSASSLANMLTLAETDARIHIRQDRLDARAWELNTPAGIIDLRTATLRPHDPEALHTKMTGVAPDFDARSERWDNFLADTFPDAELRAYVQRLVGYSAIGEVLENIMPFGLGDGGNGKGAMFETLLAVLGDYATTAPAGFLMKQRYGGGVPADVARLQGQRMVLNSEVNEEDKFDEAKVKQLAGGDTITARFLRQNFFTFTPTHQMWLFGNFTPSVDSGGYSFWRRLRIIPFKHTVPEEKVIPGLAKIMATEDGGAVLAWIARGAADYARVGLKDEPDVVKLETDEYKRSTDTVAAFVEDECILGPEQTCTVNALRNAYNRYCEANGDRAVKGRALTAALAKHGVEPLDMKINGVRYYSGARLAATDHRPADNYGQPAPGF